VGFVLRDHLEPLLGIYRTVSKKQRVMGVMGGANQPAGNLVEGHNASKTEGLFA
jgi:hypothetical protein